MYMCVCEILQSSHGYIGRKRLRQTFSFKHHTTILYLLRQKYRNLKQDTKYCVHGCLNFSFGRADKWNDLLIYEVDCVKAYDSIGA